MVLFALFFSAGRLVASEQRDFATASAAFQDGMWNRAETEFSDFIKKYPASARLSEAALMQAQAEYKQGKFSQTIALLQTNEPSAVWETSMFIGLARRSSPVVIIRMLPKRSPGSWKLTSVPPGAWME